MCVQFNIKYDLIKISSYFNNIYFVYKIKINKLYLIYQNLDFIFAKLQWNHCY